VFAAELGDFDEEEHTPAYISEFRFVPRQNEQMELEIYNQYQSLRWVRRPLALQGSRQGMIEGRLTLWAELVNQSHRDTVLYCTVL